MYVPISPRPLTPIKPDGVGRTAQIITVALTMGVIMFGGVAVTISWDQQPVDQPLIAWIAAGFAALMALMSFIIPRLVLTQQLGQQAAAIRDNARAALAPMYLQTGIIRRALLEGAAFFNLIAYIVERQLWSPGIVVVLLVMMLVPFPSQTDFENWADQVRRDLPA